jgi:hypothetical protein
VLPSPSHLDLVAQRLRASFTGWLEREAASHDLSASSTTLHPEGTHRTWLITSKATIIFSIPASLLDQTSRGHQPLAPFPVRLALPDDSPASLHLAGTAHVQELGALEDRYLAYHGRPTGARLAKLELDHLRTVIDGSTHVFDHEELAAELAHPWPTEEAKLLRYLNEQLSTLHHIVYKHIGVHAVDLRCVGIDSRGIDIRTRMGPIRIEAPATFPTPQAAYPWLNNLGFITP